ncbi:hypothetical protein IAE22_31685, partial [Bacillus sp. S34]|nr:hypothetical protein [Bacillus sp. S34]
MGHLAVARAPDATARTAVAATPSGGGLTAGRTTRLPADAQRAYARTVSQTHEPATDDRVHSTLATVDWRRMTFDLYRRVRATADPETAHAMWRETRDAMFGEH